MGPRVLAFVVSRYWGFWYFGYPFFVVCVLVFLCGFVAVVFWVGWCFWLVGCFGGFVCVRGVLLLFFGV